MKLSVRQKKNLSNLHQRSKERQVELLKIEEYAIARFNGQFKELETALGLLRTGDHIGWRALLIIHNKRTIRKYEEILGIEIREFFPEEGPSAHRSIGYSIAKKLSNYWKAVSGDVKVENRGDISD